MRPSWMRSSSNRCNRKVLALLAALALTPLFAAGCRPGTDYFKSAQTLQARGDYRAAIIQLRNLLQSEPMHAEGRFLLGTAYLEATDIGAAESELRLALKLKVAPERVFPHLGRALTMKGDYRKVLGEVTAEPTFSGHARAEIDVVRGHAFLALGQIDEARAAYTRAMQETPSPARLGLASIAMAQKDFRSAAALVDEILAKTPGDPDAWLMRGDLTRMQNQHHEALTAYEKAAQLQPGNVIALLSRASTYLSLSIIDRAQAEVEAARKLSNTSPLVHYMQAVIYVRRGNYQKAEEALRYVEQVAPGYAPALLLAGTVHYAQGSTEQAGLAMQQYLQRFPDHVFARKLLAAAHIRAGRSQLALDVLGPVLEKNRDDAQLQALIGEAFMRANQYADAHEYLDRAAALAPKDPSILADRGVTRLAMGFTEGGLADLELASRLETSNLRPDVILVMTHLRRSQFDRALVELVALEKKMPGNPLVPNLRGTAYAGKRDYGRARSSFEEALRIKADFFPAAANLAQLALRDKKPDVARSHYEAVLANNPSHVPAMMALANLAGGTGNHAQAVEWLERAIRRNPRAVPPRVFLARLHLQAGAVDKALILLVEAESLSPNDPDVLETLGLAQLASGQRAKAVGTFTSLADVAPDSASAHFRLGTAHADAGAYAQAVESLKQALRYKPDDPEIQSALMPALLREGRFSEALQLARDIQRQRPQASDGFALHGDVLMRQRKPADALKLYEKAYALGASGMLAAKVHEARTLTTGKADDRQILEWLSKHPSDATTRMYLGGAYMNSGRTREAIAHYREVLRAQPRTFMALNNLAWLLGQEGDPKALDYAEQAFLLQPDSPAVSDTLGWILLKRGETARAVESLRRAASLDPAAPEIRYHLAAALAKSGDTFAARNELERLLTGAKPFPEQQEAKALLQELATASAK